jgi:glutathione-regulated potassium-efflux system protein KefB
MKEAQTEQVLMADVSHTSFLPPILIFCAGAVIAVPLFKRIGLSAVIGYLAAGIVIGPSGFNLFSEPSAISGVAELGVVLLLFVVGLELKLPKLYSMRKDIFGLGAAQLVLTTAALSPLAIWAGAGIAGAALIGLSLALSATAIALATLEERGALQTVYGQRTFSVLLFQDLSIVPILAIVPLLAVAAGPGGAAGGQDWRSALQATAIAAGAIAAVVLAGRYLLNPLFRILAVSGAREVMTAAALLVVLGSAVLMQTVGMSMGLGAFLAGLMLAESNFRHQLEADIEPFRGLLLGLFFMSVGMSIDAALIGRNALLLALIAPLLVAFKIAVAYGLERATGSKSIDALRSAALLAPAGEFSFVLLPLALEGRLINAAQASIVTALAALTMLIGPIVAKGIEMALARRSAGRPEAEQAENFEGAHGNVLVIGFGRFGQVVSQVLLADDVEITVIDRNVEMIQSAARFGFRIYYGDGTRADVIRAAGAAKARLIAVCVDDKEAASAIVDMVHREYPQAHLYVRAFDRIHAIDLMNKRIDYQIRETFESALVFGREALIGLGIPEERAIEVESDVRRRDLVRLMMQQAEGTLGGLDMLYGTKIAPEPLSAPRSRPRGLTAETRDVIDAREP